MLTEEEARLLYTEILTNISSSNLSWIVPQVEDEISRGKVSTKSLKEVSLNQMEIFEGVREYKSTSREPVSISQAYNHVEQLGILLKSIEEISEIHRIKSQTLANLRILNPGINSFEFIAEEGASSIEVINNENLQQEEETFNQLTVIINQIKALL